MLSRTMSKFSRPLLSVAALLIFSSGCGIIQARERATAMNSWIGHHKDELIQTWGIPSGQQQLTDGTWVIEYASVVTRQDAGMSVPVAYVGGAPMYSNVGASVTQESCIKRFLARADGILSTWKLDGSGCW